jgi:hypothetical protein
VLRCSIRAIDTPGNTIFQLSDRAVKFVPALVAPQHSHFARDTTYLRFDGSRADAHLLEFAGRAANAVGCLWIEMNQGAGDGNVGNGQGVRWLDSYDRYMVPLIFEPYAADIARRAASLSPSAVLEIAAGTGVVTRALAPNLSPSASFIVTDLKQPMLDYAASRQAPDSRIKRATSGRHLPTAKQSES